MLSQSDGTYGGSWTYDAGSRLLSATQGTSRNFAYDVYGNVTQNGSSTFTMDAGLSNHIIAGGSTSTVSYDARGNLTNWNGDTMSYDLEDRLYRNQNGSADWVFLHNGAGERLVKFPGSSSILRREMARLITEANTKASPIKTGWTSDPATCNGTSFTNPPCSDPDANYIQSLYNHGVTTGCGGTDFCPDSTLNRAQMAVFVVRGYQADGSPIPACTGIFADVPCSGMSQWVPFAPYIEQLSRDQITAGCGGGNFCPGNPVTPWQIIVWLGKAPTLPGGGTWATYHPVPRGSIYTLRDEQNRVVTEMTDGASGSSSATLSVSRDNVFLGNLLVASNAAGAWTYSASDHLGSIRAIWNVTGTKVEDHRYWPYGEDAFASLNQHLSFQGMERNDATAQYFDHARTEQFNLGRFVSTDQIGGRARFPQSWNRYSYSMNNPLKYVDPDGLDWTLATAFANAYRATMARLQSATQHFNDARVFRPQIKASLGGAAKLGPIARVGVEASVSVDPKTGSVSGQVTGEATTAGGKGLQAQASLPLNDQRGFFPEGFVPTVTGGLQAGSAAAASSGEVTFTFNLTDLTGVPVGAEVGVDFNQVGAGLADLGAALGEGIREAFRQQDQQEQMAKREPCQGSSPHCN